MPQEAYIELMQIYWDRDEAIRIARLFDFETDNYWSNKENQDHKIYFAREARHYNRMALSLRRRYA